MRLLTGALIPRGRIAMPLPAVYFPYLVADATALTLSVLTAAAPGAEDWQLLRELNLLGVSAEALYRPFDTLSHGEQTKALLCALFARDDLYPLIDEPTNHLDLHGRARVADYLRQKDGFLLASHDRAFVDGCVDHVLSLNRSDVWITRGSYTAWRQRMDAQNAFEQRRDEALRRDVTRLEMGMRHAAAFSAKAEKDKFHIAPSECAAVDRGYVGARSAAMMKRAKAIERRMEVAAQEKRSLLQNVERVGTLKLHPLPPPREVLIRVVDGAVRYDGRAVAQGVRFTLRRDERMALTGPNGCGKSSVLKALCGAGGALEGDVSMAGGLRISYVPQDTSLLRGSLRDFIRQNGLDEALFKAILRSFGLGREHFDQPLESLSQGQRKKALLAKSLCEPAHLYVWDEPLNYLDVESREQIERLITQSNATMLLVEHDRRFLEAVLTRPPVEIGEG